MPPFCAPSPPYLMPESNPVSIPPELRNEDGARAQMVASLVAALSQAEVIASEHSDPDNPEQRRLLATQAYNSLCFDFPVVSTRALAALSSAFRSSSLGLGTPIFPITERFTAGLRYLVSIELSNRSTLDGLTENAENVDESVSDSKARCHDLLGLCGCVFLLAPALRLAIAHKDDGSALGDFLDAFNHSSADGVEQDNSPIEAPTSDASLEDQISYRGDVSEVQTEVPNSTLGEEIAAEVDDDDSDWEALETFTHSSRMFLSEQPAVESQGGKAGLPYLMGKVALLTSLVPLEVLQSNIWEELQLTDHLIQALKSLRLMEGMETEAVVIETANLYTELLSDHLLLGWSSSSGEIGRVVSALIRLADANGEHKQGKLVLSTGKKFRMSWAVLALHTLAKLCSKAGGYPSKTMLPSHGGAEYVRKSASNSGRGHCSMPSAAYVGNLWNVVFSNLQFLQIQMAEGQGGPDLLSQLEMVLWILCFMVKHAPGNADFRSTLLETGIFRTALQLFVKEGGDSQMEPLRHFLLLSMASSPALAQFAAAVPSFMAAMSVPDLFIEGSNSEAHAIIWPLLLRAACWQPSTSRTQGGHFNQFKPIETESIMVSALDKIVEAVADDTIQKNSSTFLKELVWLHGMLFLLDEAASVRSGQSFKLWLPGSPVDIAIGRCQGAIGSLLLYETRSVSKLSAKSVASKEKSDFCNSKSSDSDTDSDAELSTTCPPDELKDSTIAKSLTYDAENVAMQEKLKELLPIVLVHLKLLSSLTKGNQGAKID